MPNFSSPIHTSAKSILTNWIKRFRKADYNTRKLILKNTKTEISTVIISIIKSKSTRYHIGAVNEKSNIDSVLVQIEWTSDAVDLFSLIELLLVQTIQPSAVEIFFNSIRDELLFKGSGTASKLQLSGIKYHFVIQSEPVPYPVAGAEISHLHTQLRASHIWKIDSKTKINKTSIEESLMILESFRASALATFRIHFKSSTKNPREPRFLDSLFVDLSKTGPKSDFMQFVNFDSRPISLFQSGFNHKTNSVNGSRILFVNQKGTIKIVDPDREIGLNSLLAPFHQYPILNLIKNNNNENNSTHRSSLPSLCIFVPSLKMDGGAEKLVTTLMTGLKGSLKHIYLVATDINTNFGKLHSRQMFSQYADFVYDLQKTMHPEDFGSFVNDLGTREGKLHFLNIGSQWLYKYLSMHPHQLSVSGKLIDVLFNQYGSLPQHSSVKFSFTDTIFVYSKLASHARDNDLATGRLHTIYVGISGESPVRRTHRDHLVVGWLGRFSAEKRPEWFVELARKFGHLALFRMAGTGELLGTIQESSADISSLEILGFIDDTKLFFQDINLLVITSEMEGVSLSAMESIRSGIPVISTDVGGMSDLILDGENGYLVPDNLLALAGAINGIMNDTERFWKMSDAVGSTGLNLIFNEKYMLESFRSIIN